MSVSKQDESHRDRHIISIFKSLFCGLCGLLKDYFAVCLMPLFKILPFVNLLHTVGCFPHRHVRPSLRSSQPDTCCLSEPLNSTASGQHLSKADKRHFNRIEYLILKLRMSGQGCPVIYIYCYLEQRTPGGSKKEC